MDHKKIVVVPRLIPERLQSHRRRLFGVLLRVYMSRENSLLLTLPVIEQGQSPRTFVNKGRRGSTKEQEVRAFTTCLISKDWKP